MLIVCMHGAMNGLEKNENEISKNISPKRGGGETHGKTKESDEGGKKEDGSTTQAPLVSNGESKIPNHP